MSRKYNSSWNYTANYDVQIARPLDNRLVLESTLDLVSKDTFGENAKFAYSGMIVAVVNDAVYFLKDVNLLQTYILNNQPTTADYNILHLAGWEKLENKLTVGIYKLNESVNISHLNNISLICIDEVGNHTNYYQIQSEECFKEVIAGDNNAFELDISDAGLLTVHATNSGYYQINGF